MFGKNCRKCIHYAVCAELDELADIPCGKYVDKTELLSCLEYAIDHAENTVYNLHCFDAIINRKE